MKNIIYTKKVTFSEDYILNNGSIDEFNNIEYINKGLLRNGLRSYSKIILRGNYELCIEELLPDVPSESYVDKLRNNGVEFHGYTLLIWLFSNHINLFDRWKFMTSFSEQCISSGKENKYELIPNIYPHPERDTYYFRLGYFEQRSAKALRLLYLKPCTS